jgi:prevent-host-death family protein
MLDLTQDIQSLTTFRRRSGDFMKQLKKTKRPVVVTVKGKAAAIVQDARLISDCLTLRPVPMLRKASGRGSMMLLTDAIVRRERSSTIFTANITYLLELTARAARDLEIVYREKNAADSDAGARWYNGLEKSVCYRPVSSTLSRCPGSTKGEAEAAAPALRKEASRLSGHL